MAKTARQVAANPQPGKEFATLVREASLPTSRRHSILWSICELCGQQTEFAVALEGVGVYKQKANGALMAVPLTNQMRVEAQQLADDLVAQYERTMDGSDKLNNPGEMLLAYCNMQEMRGDFSVESFRDQVERRAEYSVWAKHGDMYSVPRLHGAPVGRQRPSKLYCHLHYPGRNVAARRAYQRDRKFFPEYEAIVDQMWKVSAGHLRQWNADDHILVRDAAYHWVRISKAPTRRLDESHGPTPGGTARLNGKSIETYYDRARLAYQRLMNLLGSNNGLDDLKEKGTANQSDVARHLGVSRQAVSAALKKRAKSRIVA